MDEEKLNQPNKPEQGNEEQEIPISGNGNNKEESLPGSDDLKNIKDLHSKLYVSEQPPDLKNLGQKNQTPDVGPKDFTAFNIQEPAGQPKHPGKSEFPTPEPSVTVQQISKKSGGKHLKIWLIIFILFLLPVLAIAGYSIYQGDVYWIRDLLGFGLPRDPVKAVEKVSQNMEKVKTLKSDFEINLGVEADKEKVSGKLIGNGDFDNAKDEAKLNFKLKNIELPESLKKTTKGADQIESLNLEADLITTKKEVYFKSPLLENKWYKIDLNTLANPQKLSNEKATGENFAMMAGAVVYSDGLEKSKVGELGKYVKSAKKLKDEKIKDENTYHYQIEPDIIKALESNEEFKSLPDFYKSIYKEFINKYLNFKIDYYVSKGSLLLKKQAMELSIKMDAADFGSTGIFKIKMDFQEDYKDIDKSVSIEKPKDTIEFDTNSLYQLISGGTIPGGSTGDIQIKSRDARRKADLKQIQAALEQYSVDNKGVFLTTPDDSKDGKFLSFLEPTYMSKVPIDPSHPNLYYKYESDGKTYKLTCVLENKDDPEGKKSGNYTLYIVSGPLD